MIEATEKQLGLLWLTIGLCAECSDRHSISRNHFLTSPGYEDSNNFDVLVAAGLNKRAGKDGQKIAGHTTEDMTKNYQKLDIG
ncbi:hypothetical protein OO306_04100 [Pseudomonas sp. DCB_AW]|uniref:hypothetical protein n=1 Tax=Pseudomonas sp. DCB_AW TaxID=2993596 RepID=UPI002248F3D3|nr:hypothetical protein [Pseudomonas sp. DCB_AW]MCX2684731.1 hypothetical protein [Pseudomonas sp. DCB_AW]